MKVLYMVDRRYDNEISLNFERELDALNESSGNTVEKIEIDKINPKPCIGCFGCWIKTPGLCVINDGVNEINCEIMNSDAAIYITPVLFGQFRSSMKNAIDRFIPNALPFFEKRENGTGHPPRYDKYPKQIMVGYGEYEDDEAQKTFYDVTALHKKNIKNIYFIKSDDENKTVLEEISGILGGK